MLAFALAPDLVLCVLAWRGVVHARGGCAVLVHLHRKRAGHDPRTSEGPNGGHSPVRVRLAGEGKSREGETEGELEWHGSGNSCDGSGAFAGNAYGTLTMPPYPASLLFVCNPVVRSVSLSFAFFRFVAHPLSSLPSTHAVGLGDKSCRFLVTGPPCAPARPLLPRPPPPPPPPRRYGFRYRFLFVGLGFGIRAFLSGGHFGAVPHSEGAEGPRYGQGKAALSFVAAG